MSRAVARAQGVTGSCKEMVDESLETESVNSVSAQEGCPKRVVFVLKETEPEAWINNGGDFNAYLKPPGVDEVVDKVSGLL